MSEIAHLSPDMRMPDVELPSTLGGTVNLARQSGASVVFVYPWTGRPGLPNPPDWDDIPGAHGSTPEAVRFRDLHGSFDEMGVHVLGLSGQDGAYQGEFARRLGLPFALLSDVEGAFCRALDLPTFETGGVRYLKRLTLFIMGGRVVEIFFPVIDPERHADAVLARVRAVLLG